MNLYEVTVIDRETEVIFECEARNEADARQQAVAFFPAGVKILSVKDTLFRSAN